MEKWDLMAYYQVKEIIEGKRALLIMLGLNIYIMLILLIMQYISLKILKRKSLSLNWKAEKALVCW